MNRIQNNRSEQNTKHERLYSPKIDRLFLCHFWGVMRSKINLKNKGE